MRLTGIIIKIAHSGIKIKMFMKKWCYMAMTGGLKKQGKNNIVESEIKHSFHVLFCRGDCSKPPFQFSYVCSF